MTQNKMKWVPLSDYLEPFKKKCGDADAKVSGVDINKQFIDTRAVMDGIDVSKYYIVPPKHFACNLMHIGRDERLPIAYNSSDTNYVVTSAYYVFRVKESKRDALLDEFLYIFFNSPEIDRLTWFYTDSSIRGNLKEDRFLDIQIPLPSIDEQKRIVETWKRLRLVKEQNEAIAEPLFQLCQSYIQNLWKAHPHEEIGRYITRIDKRNTDNSVKVVKSVSVKKEFNDTNAKVDKNNLGSYKIVEDGQISFVQTTGNEKCLCAAVNHFGYPIVVTSVNEVFETDSSHLLADYLHIIFRRTETDRYARFNSWGSARETFTWEDMRRFSIPIPSIEKQQAIVDIYTCAKEAKRLAEEADKLSRELCPALIQKVIHA